MLEKILLLFLYTLISVISLLVFFLLAKEKKEKGYLIKGKYPFVKKLTFTIIAVGIIYIFSLIGIFPSLEKQFLNYFFVIIYFFIFYSFLDVVWNLSLKHKVSEYIELSLLITYGILTALTIGIFLFKFKT